MISGGLDSALATKIIIDQGIEVVGFHFTSPFSSRSERTEGLKALRTAEELGIKLILQDKGPEYIDVVRHPKHGYGKNMNPCIDCRIFMLKKTGDVMAAEHAGFVVTGEVLGQRPLSQRRFTIELIERESGLESLIVRPLSAKHFNPSKPEALGILDRQRLLDISGRSRAIQYKLVEEYNLKAFGSPGGGCLLTDASYSRRLRDLLAHDTDFTMRDIEFLNTGRHFRLRADTKLIIGRNKGENERLRSLWTPSYVLLFPIGFPGPIGVLKGRLDPETTQIAGNIMAAYGKNQASTIIIESHNDSVARHEVDRTDEDREIYKL